MDPVMVDLVRDELQRASDIGELRSRAQLREAVGLGAHDLQVALDTLRERGEVSEVEPDGFRVVAGDGDGWTPPTPAAAALDPARESEEAERSAMAARRQEAGWPAADEVRVQLDAAVAAVMESDALGKLVEAGIVKAAERSVRFVFEVTP